MKPFGNTEPIQVFTEYLLFLCFATLNHDGFILTQAFFDTDEQKKTILCQTENKSLQIDFN